ncbi:MAG: hypothetical protein ABII71_01960 [Candidatus Micrarchaeota archaeon]
MVEMVADARREIFRLADSLGTNPDNAVILVGMAAESKLDHLIVRKAVMHFKNAGDPGKQEILRRLILSLEEQESLKPSLKARHGIAGALVSCLAGTAGKSGLDEDEKALHMRRTEFAFGLLVEIAGNRGITIIAPLIAALRDPFSSKRAEELLHSLGGKELGMTCPGTLEKLAIVCCKAMADGNALPWIRKLLPQIIDERRNDLIYWIVPMVEGCKREDILSEATAILDRLEEVRFFGYPDDWTIRKLEKGLYEASQDPRRNHWAHVFTRKLREQGVVLRIQGFNQDCTDLEICQSRRRLRARHETIRKSKTARPEVLARLKRA